MERLVVATPIASVMAIDRMHLLGDDIYCLSVLPNYIATDHYYDENDIPAGDDLRILMRDISLSWQRDWAAGVYCGHEVESDRFMGTF